MGCFRVDATVLNITDQTRSVVVPQMLVDSGSEATWVSAKSLEQIGVRRAKKDRAFAMANGQVITRTVGYAMIRVAPDFETVDEVVFAEEGDLALLGARTLEGLNVRVDPARKQLVAAGPIPAAANSPADNEWRS
jgi:predicted aspartyl protease